MKTRKNITRPYASVHFENGPNAKNDLKPTNAKNAHENEKNISGQRASVHFKNGPSAKNANKNEKNV